TSNLPSDDPWRASGRSTSTSVTTWTTKSPSQLFAKTLGTPLASDASGSGRKPAELMALVTKRRWGALTAGLLRLEGAFMTNERFNVVLQGGTIRGQSIA